MAELVYLNFDLLIEGSKGAYRVRLLDSPAGQATVDFKLPFNDIELENFLLRVGRTRSGRRRLESPEMKAAKQFGGRLFKAVFDDELFASYRSSVQAARKQSAGLRVRLRLNDVPELADLPWEYLYEKSSNRFLILSKDTPIVRYLDLAENIRPLSVSPPLRMIVMISSPTDYAELDTDAEQSKLRESLGKLQRRGLVHLDVLENATLATLRQRLAESDYHIFHFIGHGGFDEGAQDGVLLLENESGQGQRVSGQALGTILHDCRPLRLAVLNACEGARSSRIDPFAGVAQSLVQQGIPAVIAMQFEVTDKAAIAFAAELYASLARGYPVDAAVAEARRAIFAQENDIEWGTPVLHMRSPDGRIFNVDPKGKPVGHAPPASAPVDRGRASQLEDLYIEALSYFFTEDWDAAVDALGEVVSIQSDYKSAADKLEVALQQQRLTSLYAKAENALDSDDWPAAIEHLEGIVELDEDYRDVSEQLAHARLQSNLARMYKEAQDLHGAKHWQAAVNVMERIRKKEPDHPDPDGIFEAARQERVLEDLYSNGVRLLDEDDWVGALIDFEAILALAPDYRNTSPLAEKARKSKAADEKQRKAEAAAKRKEAAAAKRRKAAEADERELATESLFGVVAGTPVDPSTGPLRRGRKIAIGVVVLAVLVAFLAWRVG